MADWAGIRASAASGAFFRKRLPERTLLHWQTMLDRHTAKAIFLSRCLPGTRLPTYIAAGMLGRRAWAFVFWFTIAVLIWTPFLMLLTAVIGPPIMSFFKEVFHAPGGDRALARDPADAGEAGVV